MSFLALTVRWSSVGQPQTWGLKSGIQLKPHDFWEADSDTTMTLFRLTSLLAEGIGNQEL